MTLSIADIPPPLRFDGGVAGDRSRDEENAPQRASGHWMSVQKRGRAAEPGGSVEKKRLSGKPSRPVRLLHQSAYPPGAGGEEPFAKVHGSSRVGKRGHGRVGPSSDAPTAQRRLPFSR